MEAVERTVVPYESVGPYVFGTNPEECTISAGPPDREFDDRIMRQFHQYRGRVDAIFKGGELVQVQLNKPEPVSFAGMNLMADPGALGALQAGDPDFVGRGAYITFQQFGICLAAFGKRRLPEGKHVIVYARNQCEYMAVLASM